MDDVLIVEVTAEVIGVVDLTADVIGVDTV